jgi:Domain of unknown function (DUF4272)
MARTPDEVARRTLALFAVANAAYERPPKRIRGWLERTGVSRFLSPWEADFLNKDTAPEEEVFAASWTTEALQVGWWTSFLPHPTRRTLSNWGSRERFLRPRTPS